MDCAKRDGRKDVEMSKREIIEMVVETVCVLLFIGGMWCVWVIL